ncbi:peptidase S24/S26A/S26B/S26C [Usnea florida]
MTWVARLLSRLPRLTFDAANILLIGHFLTTHVGSFALTAGPSMLPTINAQGVRVYIDRTYRRGRGIQLGDVVDFHHPMVPGVSAIKRVMGMPGDFVVKDGGEGSDKMMIQVPDGHCWLLGDNLLWSRDSRVYGPIPLALIQGKVIARVSPWSERGWIKNGLQRPEDP